MGSITIKQAGEGGIPVIESILLDTVNWLNEISQPLWKAEDVAWGALSKSYQAQDFHIAYADGDPSGCVALIDHDPFFWPDIEKGGALFIHKLAVIKTAKGSGAADALMDHAKKLCRRRRIPSVRLDCHQHRPKLRAFYERHGFTCLEEKRLAKDFDVAFYSWKAD